MKEITCKEAKKYIAKFIENNMEDEDMELFINHVDNCPQCMEELSIQYLVAVGMNRLEEGGTFDLSGELHDKLQSYQNKIRFRRQKNATYFAMEICLIAATAVISIFFLY